MVDEKARIRQERKQLEAEKKIIKEREKFEREKAEFEKRKKALEMGTVNAAKPTPTVEAAAVVPPDNKATTTDIDIQNV